MITACASAIAFYAVISDVADADPLVNLAKAFSFILLDVSDHFYCSLPFNAFNFKFII
jgi:hypothetical protein